MKRISITSELVQFLREKGKGYEFTSRTLFEESHCDGTQNHAAASIHWFWKAGFVERINETRPYQYRVVQDFKNWELRTRPAFSRRDRGENSGDTPRELHDIIPSLPEAKEVLEVRFLRLANSALDLAEKMESLNEQIQEVLTKLEGENE